MANCNAGSARRHGRSRLAAFAIERYAQSTVAGAAVCQYMVAISPNFYTDPAVTKLLYCGAAGAGALPELQGDPSSEDPGRILQV